MSAGCGLPAIDTEGEEGRQIHGQSQVGYKVPEEMPPARIAHRRPVAELTFLH